MDHEDRSNLSTDPDGAEPDLFSTDFDLDPHSGATLRIENAGLVNREKIASSAIGNTRFSARLSSVTYGTLSTAPACLVVFDFAFAFRASSRARFTRADIAVEFAQARDAAFSAIEGIDPLTDPVVRMFAPVELWGVAKKVRETRTWNFTVPVMVSTPMGVEAGVEVGREAGKEVDVDRRMNVRGDTYSDERHVMGDNLVEWSVDENAAQKDGIPFRLTTAAVVTLPTTGLGIQVKVVVKPAVAFSLNPIRLLQRKHDPIYLDGKTAKGKSPVPEGKTDFGDASIDWASVIKFQSEYQVSHCVPDTGVD